MLPGTSTVEIRWGFGADGFGLGRLDLSLLINKEAVCV